MFQGHRLAGETGRAFRQPAGERLVVCPKVSVEGLGLSIRTVGSVTRICLVGLVELFSPAVGSPAPVFGLTPATGTKSLLPAAAFSRTSALPESAVRTRY